MRGLPSDVAVPPPHRSITAVYAKLADYTVIDDGREVGRIYEDPHASQPWFWSLTVFGAHLARTKPSGRTANIEDAKREFEASYRKWLVWAKLEKAE